jgi:hypothetical protein
VVVLVHFLVCAGGSAATTVILDVRDDYDRCVALNVPLLVEAV